MGPRSRRRRNWVIFWLLLVAIPVLLYVAFGLFLSLTIDFSELG